MKSSMTFIRGNKCTEKKKGSFKNDREAKRFNEGALAFSNVKDVFFMNWAYMYNGTRTEYSHKIRPVSYLIHTRNVFEMYAN